MTPRRPGGGAPRSPDLSLLSSAPCVPRRSAAGIWLTSVAVQQRPVVRSRMRARRRSLSGAGAEPRTLGRCVCGGVVGVGDRLLGLRSWLEQPRGGRRSILRVLVLLMPLLGRGLLRVWPTRRSRAVGGIALTLPLTAVRRPAAETSTGRVRGGIGRPSCHGSARCVRPLIPATARTRDTAPRPVTVHDRVAAKTRRVSRRARFPTPCRASSAY